MNENARSDRIPEETNPSPAAPEAAPDGRGQASETPAAPESPSQKRNFFDIIGDFFKKMTIGIFKFIVKVVEYIIGADWRKILKNIYSMWRAIFWCTVWLLAIFAGWIVFALETFLKFWRWVGNILVDLLRDFWAVVADHAGEIWFVIAIIGSIYGLFRVTFKHPDWFLYLLHRGKKTPAEKAPVADGKK